MATKTVVSDRDVRNRCAEIQDDMARIALAREAELTGHQMRQAARDFDLLAKAAPAFDANAVRGRLNALKARMVLLLGTALSVLALGCTVSSQTTAENVATPEPIGCDIPAVHVGCDGPECWAVYNCDEYGPGQIEGVSCEPTGGDEHVCSWVTR